MKAIPHCTTQGEKQEEAGMPGQSAEYKACYYGSLQQRAKQLYTCTIPASNSPLFCPYRLFAMTIHANLGCSYTSTPLKRALSSLSTPLGTNNSTAPRKTNFSLDAFASYQPKVNIPEYCTLGNPQPSLTRSTKVAYPPLSMSICMYIYVYVCIYMYICIALQSCACQE